MHHIKLGIAELFAHHLGIHLFPRQRFLAWKQAPHQLGEFMCSSKRHTWMCSGYTSADRPRSAVFSKQATHLTSGPRHAQLLALFIGNGHLVGVADLSPHRVMVDMCSTVLKTVDR